LLYGGNITKIRDDSINLSTDIRLVNKQKDVRLAREKKRKKNEVIKTTGGIGKVDNRHLQSFLQHKLKERSSLSGQIFV